MKFKHNKKRNTAFLFECLVRELTKAALNEDQGREKNILALIKEYFSKGTVLHEELNLYKSLKPDSDISLGIAEKLLYEVKIDYSSLDKKKVFSAQSSLIKKINKDFSKNIFSNFVPNYKSLATIYQILNPGKLNAKSRIILEEQFLKDMTSKQTLTENKIEKLENSIDLYNDMWYGVQNKILKDDLWNGNYFFDEIEKWVKHEFGHNMKRKGTISYRSSSLFVKEELNTLENFMV